MAVTYPGWQHPPAPLPPSVPSVPPSSRKAPILSLVALTQNWGWAPTASGNTSAARGRALSEKKTKNKTRSKKHTPGGPRRSTQRKGARVRRAHGQPYGVWSPSFLATEKVSHQVPRKAPLWISPPTRSVWQSGSQGIQDVHSIRASRWREHTKTHTHGRTCVHRDTPANLSYETESRPKQSGSRRSRPRSVWFHVTRIFSCLEAETENSVWLRFGWVMFNTEGK